MSEYCNNLRTIYQELCRSYRAIDDFRSKLLGYLPLASGAGIFFLLSDTFTEQTKRIFAESVLRPIGVFGLLITLGLFLYELSGIKKCNSLIKAGTQLEVDLGVCDGQFNNRPSGLFSFINKLFAAGIIYPAVIAAWTFLAFDFSSCINYSNFKLTDIFKLRSIQLFTAGFALSFLYNLWLVLDLHAKNKAKIHREDCILK